MQKTTKKPAKQPYAKPTITKHKPLRDITTGHGSPKGVG